MLTVIKGFRLLYDIFTGNVNQWLILEKHIKCVIYDKICEPLHFCYILGATLNTFKVTSITSIIMTSFVDNERSMTANVRCTTRPTCLVSAPGRGRWLSDLAPRGPVERAPRRFPGGHPEHTATAAGRDSDLSVRILL